MFDVVVIGAGPSGLQAALSAQQEGLSVAVIEARDRVGGKVWSVPLASGRGNVDLGAAWINDTLQPRIWSYVQKFGMPVVKQRIEGLGVVQYAVGGDRLVFENGHTPTFPREELQNLEVIRDHIQEKSLKRLPNLPEDDAVTLDQYVRNLGATENTCRLVNVWAKVMHGVESTDQSACFFIDYCRRNKGLLAIRADDHTGGQYLRLPAGAQAIMKSMASLLGHENIHLSSPVATIENEKHKVTVITKAGRKFVARKCILSIPSTLYRDLNIQPQLPQPLQELSGSTRLGDYNKSIVCYDTPWWREENYNGLFMSYDGYIAVARDTSVDEKRLYCLTCFMNGKRGFEWSQMAPHDQRRAVLEQIAHAFCQGKDSEAYRPIEIFNQIWKHEEYSKGALVPIPALGYMTKFTDINGKAVGNLHFAGTEYASEWKGYMEGALDSGEAAAAEVMKALSTQSVEARL
ncbi:Amine oxidase [Curvularia clavata]|uniref:Amine oxidase n=1 Tax=Curvularia clavata TaxID=95742 RepID=A0A9Q8Z8V9_CURCL|nr:Amine oxidase [Curvularia clavata]